MRIFACILTWRYLKVTKFDTFNGIGNPIAHLRAYCDKLVGVGKNDASIIRLFSSSLRGEALEWFTSQELALAQDFLEGFQFNIEVVPDRYYLEKIKQKTIEISVYTLICNSGIWKWALSPSAVVWPE